MNSRLAKWPFVVLLLLVLVGSGVLRAYGQGITTGTISGVVVDPAGAVIQNAQITATNMASGILLKTTSAGDGNFAISAVPIGTYRVQIMAAGFTMATINDVTVSAGVTADLRNVALKVGATQSIEVNGSAATVLSTTESQVTTTFSTQSMETLPLNNGFDTIAEVIPGVVSTEGDNFSNHNGDNFSVNGQSGRNNNFELDGQTNNDNSVAGPQIFFGNQDAIAEIQVVTNDYGAQYGRNAGAVVNYITKAGTNAFHGSGFELYQGQALSSMTNGDKSPLFGFCASGQTSGCSAPVLPRYVENRYGATIGGPVLKDKLFFFGSTFWDRVFTGVVPSQSVPDLTPTPAGLATLASAFPNDPAVAIAKAAGPYGVSQGNPQPIPSTETTETIMGPNGVSVPVQFAAVTRSIPTPFTDEEEMGRLDWQPTSTDHMFIRFFYQNQISSGISESGSAAVAAGQFLNVPGTTYSVGADWTHTFSPHWVDQIRYAFQQSLVDFEGGALPNCTVTGLTNCTPQVDFTGTNLDQGFGVVAAFPQGRTVKVTQVQNNATWSHGNHTVLFGGEFDYQNSPNIFLPLYNGEYLYNDFQSFIQDSGSLLLANGNPVIAFTEPDAAGYIQDDWKVTPTFTAHIGMRWEYFGQSVNKLHDETVARESNPSTAFWSTSLPLADRTVPAVNEDYKNFEPRIGLAWNPSFDSKLVVNAGYAINANPAFYNIFSLDAIASPVANTGSIACSGNCLSPSGSATGAAVRAQNLPSLPTGGDPRYRDQTYVPTNFRTPYVQSWTLGLQHQLGHGAVGAIRYVGVKTTQNFQSVDANPFLLPVATAFPNTPYAPPLCTNTTAPGYGRPNCNLSNLALVTNGGWQNYSGLDLNLTSQSYHGLTGTLSYTWSREIDNVTDVFSTGAAGSTSAFAQNPLNTDEGERGVDGNSFPNVVGAQFTYQLPNLVKTNGLSAKLINGFVLSGLYRYTGGQPFNPFQPQLLDGFTGDSSFCDSAFNFSSVGPALDTCRLVVSNPRAPLQSVAYLNPYTGPFTGGVPTLGTPEYVEYNSNGPILNASGTAVVGYNPGTPMDPTSAHWIINNQANASSVGNPYPGSGRNILRGAPLSDLDINVFKNFAVTERVKLQLQFDGYNVLNQMFRGTGIANVGASSPGVVGPTNPFLSTAFNALATAPGDSSGQRFFLFGGKVVF